MVDERGKKSTGPDAPDARDDDAYDADESGDSRGPIPDLVRRALAMGLSGFFLTEETIRKALGDTVPRDWVDFASDQSERTRIEFLERLSYEIGRTLENIDVAAVLQELLEGRTLEVTAQIRLGAPEEGKSPSSVRIVKSSAKT